VTRQNPVFHQLFNNLQGAISQHASAVDTLPRALKLVEGTLDQQATLWSYVDDFRYLALLCFATIPIGFALKRISRSRKVAAH